MKMLNNIDETSRIENLLIALEDLEMQNLIRLKSTKLNPRNLNYQFGIVAVIEENSVLMNSGNSCESSKRLPIIPNVAKYLRKGDFLAFHAYKQKTILHLLSVEMITTEFGTFLIVHSGDKNGGGFRKTFKRVFY